MPYASMFEIMSGRISEYPPVISTMISTEVMGARMIPAKTAPMPTKANAPIDSAEWWNSAMSRAPIAPPAIPPIIRAGAKMPPAPPLEYENTVAAILSRQRVTSTATVSFPASAALRVA